VPTIGIFVGEECLAGLLGSLIEAFAANVQGGQIDDCGHYVMEEQPEYVAQKLLDFFQNFETTI
jgi:pimeloyl-ACP methyl ester carboxylesterase